MENEKTELEKHLYRGLYGDPDPKKAERLHYLGELRERLILALPESIVKKGAVPEELEQALDNIRTKKMIIKNIVRTEIILKYEKLGQKHGVEVTTTYNPHYKGDTGLVVVSSFAVDLPDDKVFPRKLLH